MFSNINMIFRLLLLLLLLLLFFLLLLCIYIYIYQVCRSFSDCSQHLKIMPCIF